MYCVDCHGKKVHFASAADIQRHDGKIDVSTFAKDIFGDGVEVGYPGGSTSDPWKGAVVGWVSVHSSGPICPVVRLSR